MRSTTQTIVVDRLAHALKSRGMEMKRTTVLEIAAQAFGYLDGNAFVAAMKEGRHDPLEAEHLGDVSFGDLPLVVLRDPSAGHVYALDRNSLSDERRNRYGVSPYGGLLAMPGELPVSITDATVQNHADATDETERRIYFFPEDSDDPRLVEWQPYLGFTIDVGKDPVPDVVTRSMVDVNGRMFFLFECSEEYDDHEQAMGAIAAFKHYVNEHASFFERLGGFMRYVDKPSSGWIEFEAYLPADLARDVDDVADWHRAVGHILGAEGPAVMARFHPQAWQKDQAVDVDPEGNVEFDVTFEVLVMGRKEASTIRDNADDSDALTNGALAPEWIRDWKGPSYVTVGGEISSFNQELDDEAAIAAKAEMWSCGDCGETAQDGSGTCVTCGIEDQSYFSSDPETGKG